MNYPFLLCFYLKEIDTKKSPTYFDVNERQIILLHIALIILEILKYISTLLLS